MKLKYFSTLLLCIFTLNALSQRDKLSEADEFYKRRFYKEAIDLYKEALEENIIVNKFYMTQQIARTYKMLFDYENAEMWYAKLLALNSEDNSQINYLHYAQILMNNEKYEAAKTAFSSYYNIIQKPELAKKAIENCNWAINHRDSLKRMNVYVTNIETGSRSMGIYPYKNGLIYAKPQIQYFDKKTAFYDLAFLSKTDSITFDSAKVIPGETNKSFYEGTPYISTDGKFLYYTSNATEAKKYRSRLRDKKKLPISKDGLNILKIYRAENVNGKWINVKELNINSNEYSCAFPNISNDGNTLYFSSKKNGNYDIYYSTKVNDTLWGPAINCGSNVNSGHDEFYPIITDTALYFSSKGKNGFGGADIYYSMKEGANFGVAQNMGKPINSSKDDFSFVTIKNEQNLLEGYLSSNRYGTHGYDHIYYFKEIPKPIFPDTIKGIATNRITNKPIEGVKIELKKYKELNLEFDSTGSTNSNGAMHLVLVKHLPYKVTFTKEGFKQVEVEIPTLNREDVIAKFGRIVLEPVTQKNTIIQIPNVYFDFDKASIKEESYKILDNVVSYLNDNPEIKVELSAHTDSRGSDSYNIRLSQKRANSIVKYLVEKGINPKRLKCVGYGETKLLNKCKNRVKCSDEEHEFNRRVEMKVL